MLVIQDLKYFSISNWYDLFQNVTLQTIIIEIVPELLEKLCSGDSRICIEEVCTTKYIEEINSAIDRLGKNAFVKNNWHAPKDAKVFSFGNLLQVTNISDLLLYLTASELITNDFTSHKGIPFCIALKPWINIHPASEFRCLVINNVLIGITPRDWPTFYAHFSEEGPNIISAILEFYQRHIMGKFSRKTYTFDVLLMHPEQIKLLDFGFLNCRTNLYAFKWNEIKILIEQRSSEVVPPVFRYLESDIGIVTRQDFTLA